MGRSTIEKTNYAPFQVTLQELLALQKLVIPERGRHLKQVIGAPLTKSSIRGRGMDFQENRHYSPGDDIRLMDWRVTARTQKPHIKIFQEERERPVLLFLDLAPSMFFGSRVCLKSVLAARLAALLTWVAKSQGDRVGGMLSSAQAHNFYLPHAKQQSLLAYFKAISAYTQEYANPQWSDWTQVGEPRIFIQRMSELMHRLKPGSLILMISDWYYPLDKIKPYLYQLRLHHDIQLYQILDPIEMSAPKQGIYPISDGQDVLALNLHESRVQANYQQFCDEHTLNLAQLAKHLHLSYHACSVDTDLALLARKSLRRGPYV